MAKSSWRKWVIFLAAAVLIVLCLGIFVIWRSGLLRFSMDDGPFHGRPAAEVPARDPDQVCPLSKELTLQVFNNPKGEHSPIVTLVDREGKTKWAIYADGYEPDDVRSIRFDEVSKGTFQYRVEGVVDWTYGREVTRWYIGRSGRLREYWYSW